MQNPQQATTKLNNQYILKTHPHDQVGYSMECRVGSAYKTASIILHTTLREGNGRQKPRVVLTDAEKHLASSTAFHGKVEQVPSHCSIQHGYRSPDQSS